MEALSRIAYANGVVFFTSQGIKSSEDRDEFIKYIQTLQRYLDHLQ